MIASKPSKFYLRYGLAASGNFKKNFSNGGEEILLNDPDGNPLMDFFYSDDPPWPTEPDGAGYSLVSTLFNPTGNPAEAVYWAKSYHIAGSPFADEPYATGKESESLKPEDIRVYPNPTSDLLTIKLPASLNSFPATLSLYGINGNLVYQEEIKGSSTLQLSGLNLTSGVYLLRVRTEIQVYNRKVIFR